MEDFLETVATVGLRAQDELNDVMSDTSPNLEAARTVKALVDACAEYLSMYEPEHAQTPIDVHGQTILVDTEIAPLIVALNKYPGIMTLNSCQDPLYVQMRVTSGARAFLEGNGLTLVQDRYSEDVVSITDFKWSVPPGPSKLGVRF